MTEQKRIVRVNERGLRVGEDHQNAKLTDVEVDMIRNMHEQGMSYNTLAEKFEIGKSTVADICKCRRRALIPSATKIIVSQRSGHSTEARKPNRGYCQEKLMEAEIKAIKLLHSTGRYSMRRLGMIFHISHNRVSRIIRKEVRVPEK